MTARVLRGWLGSNDRERLAAASTSASGWQLGRLGTGYEKVEIRHVEAFAGLVRAALQEIAADPNDGNFWDAYLLRYSSGSHAPLHRDPCEAVGRRHVRLNALVQAPKSGGELFIAGSRISLVEGDAAIFHPDEDEHEVRACEGERIVFSVGAWTLL